MYGDLGKFGAMKAHTLFTEIKPVRVPQPEWDALRIGMTCTDTANIADMQAVIDKMCAKTKKCDYEQMQAFKLSVRNIMVAQQRIGKRFTKTQLATYFSKRELELYGFEALQ